MTRPAARRRLASAVAPRTPVAAAVAAVLAAALAICPAPGGAHAFDLGARVVEHRLDNGMLFLLVRRPRAPVFTGYVRFRVGGLDEPRGASGVAHLFEHMAFKGTSRIGVADAKAEGPILAEMDRVGDALAALLPRQDSLSPDEARRLADLTGQMAALRERHRALVVKDELSRLYLRNGADGLNATTSKDLTSYFVSLPSNRLELWAILEADRMADPVLREFWSEKDVVMEERRMRVESDPGGRLYEAFIGAAFPVGDPYHTPTVGTWDDLRALTAETARRFHAEHYAPGNAVGALVGDIDVERAKGLLDATFGAIPGRRAVADAEPALAPEPGAAEVRVEVPFDAEPAVLVGWRKPRAPHPDDYVADVLHDLLTEGRTSRLHRALVRDRAVVTSVGSFGGPGNRRPNLLAFTLQPRHPHTTEEAEAALYAELDRLRTEPVSAAELEGVRTRVEASFLRGLQTNDGLASQLTYFQAAVGDWRYMLTHAERVRAVTPDDILAFARRWLVAANRVVAVRTPAGGGP